MKPNDRTRGYQSNVSGETVDMTIDASSFAHIMQVLTDLYEDSELAVIREYSTNALDAHIEVGECRPIEITLPTALSPFFKVRDYGVGLSAEDIRNVYCKYGASTKRDSNDVVGMLGLGCKSALTYQDQFTVTSTKDGRKVQVLVSRKGNGGGEMEIVSDVADNSGDRGTEVIVPTKRHNAFDSKAADFFRFWKAGTVLVGGEQPEPVEGLRLSDTIMLSADVKEHTVVMGNVAYPFLSDVDVPTYGSNYNERYHIVSFVDIGAVSFTPSRESLMDTTETKTVLAKIVESVAALRDRSVVKAVADAATPAEAVNQLRMGRAIGFRGNATYQGREVPLVLNRHPKVKGPDGQMTTDKFANAPESKRSFLKAGSRYGKVNGERAWTLDFETKDELWFEGFESKQLSPVKREKLALWLTQEGLDHGPQVYFDTLSADERFWTNGRTVYQWADVDAIVLPKDGSATGGVLGSRPRGSYDCIVSGSYGTVQAADIDTSKPIRWMHGNQHQLSGHGAIRSGVLDKNEGTYVCLAANRIEKFQRDFPMAVRVDEAARSAAQAWQDAIDKDDVTAACFQGAYSEECDVLRSLDPQRLLDPELREGIALANRPVRTYTNGLDKFGPWLSGYNAYSRHSLPATDKPNPFKRYSLLTAAQGYSFKADRHTEDIYLYANTAYRTKAIVAEANATRKAA